MQPLLANRPHSTTLANRVLLRDEECDVWRGAKQSGLDGYIILQKKLQGIADNK
jgi:hypothetical protein